MRKLKVIGSAEAAVKGVGGFKGSSVCDEIVMCKTYGSK